MYVKLHHNGHVIADVYPHAAPTADARFLASSPHFAIMPEGDILFNARPVTVELVAKEAGEMLLAIIEAGRIAGSTVDRNVLQSLAEMLIRHTRAHIEDSEPWPASDRQEIYVQ